MYSNSKKILISEIKKHCFYSLMVDDSVDVTHLNNMCVFIRYLNEKFEIQTSFLALSPIGRKGATATNLHSI
jgi:hypothetical protein